MSHWPAATFELASPVRRIAILRALYLGDLLCTVPAFRALRRRFPDAHIDLIGLPWAEDLVARLPYLDRLIVFPGYDGIPELPYDPARSAAFFRYLHGKYDLALQMHGDGSTSNGFVAELGAAVSVGYRRDGDARLTYSLPFPDGEHEIRRWLRLAELLGARESDQRLEFPVQAHERAAAAALLAAAAARPLIGMHAGSKDPARRWPVERFTALAARLRETTGATIVLTGTAAERSLSAAIAARTPGAIDLAGHTDLGLLAAVLERLDLLITNDTGAAHMAAATRTPSVVLFGPGRPDEWGPLDRTRHRVVDALIYGGHPHTALKQLPVEPVLGEALRSLERAIQVGDTHA